MSEHSPQIDNPEEADLLCSKFFWGTFLSVVAFAIAVFVFAS